MPLDPDFIEKLLFEDEGITLDFKSSQYPFEGADNNGKSELLKDILAFTNAWRDKTAYILIGVEERKGGRSKVVGISKDLDDAQLQQFVNAKIQRPIMFSYHTHLINGDKIGVISIAVQKRPVYLTTKFGKLEKNTVYLRRGSSTDTAKPDEIAQMGGSETSIDTPQEGTKIMLSPVLLERLNGIYVLQHLAREYLEQYHIQIMRQFCAFVCDPPIAREATDLLLGKDVQAVMDAIGDRSKEGIGLENKESFNLDFSSANLNGLMLKDADLSSANFREASLSHTDLWGSNLFKAQCQNAKFYCSGLVGVNLSGAFLEGANLANASLSNAKLCGSELVMANLSDAFLKNADLSGANLLNTNLSGAKLCYPCNGNRSPVKGLTQEQLNQACADLNNPPRLHDCVLDATTGKPLVWHDRSCPES